MSQGKNWRNWALLLAAFALALVFGLTQRRPSLSQLSRDAGGRETESTSQADQGTAPALRAATSAIAQKLSDTGPLKKLLADYRIASEYPDWSRPHDNSTESLLAPNASPPRETSFKVGEDAYRCVLDRDRYWVDSKTPFVVRLKVIDGQNKAAAFTLSDAYVAADPPDGGDYRKVQSFALKDDGRAPDARGRDGEWTGSFVVSQIPALASSKRAIVVTSVRVGTTSVECRADFAYSMKSPIRVIDGASRVEEGSLAVDLRVEVADFGAFVFQANLYDQPTGKPVAYVQRGETLTPGAHTVKLVFFGRAVRRSGLHGPFVVRDIRGNFDEPNVGGMAWASDVEMTTPAYSEADFADDEWTSPEKTQKIRHFEELIGEAAEAQAK